MNRHRRLLTSVAVLALCGAGAFSLVALAQESGGGQSSNARLYATPGNPSGTANTTTGVMMGLGSSCTITPKTTGNIQFTITGQITNSVGGDGFNSQMLFGTGSAPANGAAPSGSGVGATIQATVATASDGKFITFTGIASGLTIGTAYWQDLRITAVTGGSASISQLTCVAVELR